MTASHVPLPLMLLIEFKGVRWPRAIDLHYENHGRKIPSKIIAIYNIVDQSFVFFRILALIFFRMEL